MAASDTLSDWLASTDFMQLLLERLCRPMGEMGRSARRLQKAAQRNVASILVAIAATQPSPLAEQLTQRQYLRTMLHRAADPPSDLLSPVLQVCIALLEPNRPLPSLTQAWSALMPGPLPDAQGALLLPSLRVHATFCAARLAKSVRAPVGLPDSARCHPSSVRPVSTATRSA